MQRNTFYKFYFWLINEAWWEKYVRLHSFDILDARLWLSRRMRWKSCCLNKKTKKTLILKKVGYFTQSKNINKDASIKFVLLIHKYIILLPTLTHIFTWCGQHFSKIGAIRILLVSSKWLTGTNTQYWLYP